MEKKMQKPEMEIIHFETEDVIVASGGGTQEDYITDP